MRTEHLNLEHAVDELQREGGRPTGKAKTLAALRGTRRSAFGWRFAAVAAGCALLMVPVILNRPSGVSHAASFTGIVQASAGARNIHEVTTMYRQGKAHPFSERWSSGFLYAMDFKKLMGPFAAIRRGKDFYFQRFQNYEVISAAPELTVKFDNDAFVSPYSVKSLLKATTAKPAGARLISQETVTLGGKKLQKFTVRNSEWHVRPTTLYADPEIGMIVRTEQHNPKGELVVVSELDYPESIDPATFLPPPPTPGIKRFDQQVEQQALLEFALENRIARSSGGEVKLAGVFQDPTKNIWILWEGEIAGNDTRHPARIIGIGPAIRSQKVREQRPYVTGSAVKADAVVSSADIQAPIYRGGKFVGYGTFKNVPIRQSLTLHSLTAPLKAKEYPRRETP
jgi:hypothetical protein